MEIKLATSARRLASEPQAGLRRFYP